MAFSQSKQEREEYKNCGIQVGSIVISTMGRDRGMYFIVIDSDDEYVFLVDGMVRKIERVKKKKIKHIEVTEHYSENIAEKVKNKNKISNHDVKKALKEILKKEVGG